MIYKLPGGLRKDEIMKRYNAYPDFITTNERLRGLIKEHEGKAMEQATEVESLTGLLADCGLSYELLQSQAQKSIAKLADKKRTLTAALENNKELRKACVNFGKFANKDTPKTFVVPDGWLGKLRHHAFQIKQALKPKGKDGENNG